MGRRTTAPHILRDRASSLVAMYMKYGTWEAVAKKIGVTKQAVNLVIRKAIKAGLITLPKANGLTRITSKRIKALQSLEHLANAIDSDKTIIGTSKETKLSPYMVRDTLIRERDVDQKGFRTRLLEGKRNWVIQEYTRMYKGEIVSSHQLQHRDDAKALYNKILRIYGSYKNFTDDLRKEQASV